MDATRTNNFNRRANGYFFTSAKAELDEEQFAEYEHAYAAITAGLKEGMIRCSTLWHKDDTGSNWAKVGVLIENVAKEMNERALKKKEGKDGYVFLADLDECYAWVSFLTQGLIGHRNDIVQRIKEREGDGEWQKVKGKK